MSLQQQGQIYMTTAINIADLSNSLSLLDYINSTELLPEEMSPSKLTQGKVPSKGSKISQKSNRSKYTQNTSFFKSMLYEAIRRQGRSSKEGALEERNIQINLLTESLDIQNKNTRELQHQIGRQMKKMKSDCQDLMRKLMQQS